MGPIQRQCAVCIQAHSAPTEGKGIVAEVLLACPGISELIAILCDSAELWMGPIRAIGHIDILAAPSEARGYLSKQEGGVG